MRISDWSSDVCSSDLREAIGVEAMAIAAVGKPVRIATPPLASGIFAQQHLNIPPHIVRHDGKAASSEWIGRQGNLGPAVKRSEEHTSELQSLMRNSYAVFCLKKKKTKKNTKKPPK